jgi:putative intracellular protease/amidase
MPVYAWVLPGERTVALTQRLLVLLSERGHWGEELIGPLETFDAKGYEVTFITPTGQRPEALPPSTDAKYIDPPPGRSVTSEEVAEKTRQINASPRLDKPRDLSSWFPERPCMSSNNYPREKVVEVLEQGLTRWGW